MNDEKPKKRHGRDQRGGERPPRLTERQRAEARRARRRRPARGPRKARKEPRGSNPLNRGVRAFIGELGRAFAFLAGLVSAFLGSIASALTSLLEALLFIGDRLLGLLSALRQSAADLLGRLGRAIGRLDRLLTPGRAAALICLAGCVTLGISQFTDYRAIEIGRPDYGGVLDLAGAPRVDVLTPFQAHSVLVLVLTAVAAFGTVASLLTGRGRPASLTAAAGLATVIITLAADLPRGLEVGDAGIAYANAVAVLLGGFWLQLAGGVVLLVGGLVLWAAGSRPGPVPVRADRSVGSTA